MALSRIFFIFGSQSAHFGAFSGSFDEHTINEKL